MVDSINFERVKQTTKYNGLYGFQTFIRASEQQKIESFT